VQSWNFDRFSVNQFISTASCEVVEIFYGYTRKKWLFMRFLPVEKPVENVENCFLEGYDNTLFFDIM
jgi:hypothetical protein